MSGDRPGFPGRVCEEWVKELWGCLMLGSFLTVKPGLQRESLVEEMSRRAWQEKGGAEPDGNEKTENTNEQRSGPHLVLGPTSRERKPVGHSEKGRPFSRGPLLPKWLIPALTASGPHCLQTCKQMPRHLTGSRERQQVPQRRPRGKSQRGPGSGAQN